MNTPWVKNVETLVGHVKSGDTIGPSGFHFVRSPIAQLRALGEAGVNDLTYVSWGGGLPLEFLLSQNAIRKVIFCFSSLDIFGLAPRFRRALERQEIEVEERIALGFMKGLRAGMEQLPFEIIQDPMGSDLRSGFARDLGGQSEGGVPIAATPPLAVDAFLLHAQRADDAGNVEIRGARGLDLLTLFGARKVLVTVEVRVPTGTLGAPNGFVLSRNFVTALTVAPGGAWPTSCLPDYPADYRALQLVAKLTADEPVPAALLEPSRERLEEVTRIASVPASEIRSNLRAWNPKITASPAAEFSIDELMVSAIAHTVDDSSICSVGSVSPLATIAYLLAKHLWAPNTTIMSANGGYLDIGSRPMSIITSELLDFHTAAAHIGSDDSYSWYYQRGRISHEVVSSAQIDRRANSNTSWIANGDRRIRLPGQGGMGDVADMHQRYFLYLPRHSKRTLVEKVDFTSATRSFHDDRQRTRFGYRPGPTTLITNLGIFEYDIDIEELVLTHLHPGVSFAQLQDATGFEVRSRDTIATTQAPSAEELRVIREELDPLGVRRLEFVPSAERSALIDELLTAEEYALSGDRS